MKTSDGAEIDDVRPFLCLKISAVYRSLASHIPPPPPLFFFQEVPGFITEEINMNSACMSSVKCNINPHSAKYGINLLVGSLFFFSLFLKNYIYRYFFSFQ